jgi:hypothetical protein
MISTASGSERLRLRKQGSLPLAVLIRQQSLKS